MPDKFRVGLVQMSATPEPDKNLQRAIDRVHQAAAKGAQIVCLPELFQTQYFCQREDHALFDLAEPIPGPSSDKLAAAAKQNGVVLIASLFEKRAAGVYQLPSQGVASHCRWSCANGYRTPTPRDGSWDARCCFVSRVEEDADYSGRERSGGLCRLQGSAERLSQWTALRRQRGRGYGSFG